MKKVLIFLAEGFEEMEAVIPLDLLRRIGVDAKLISITGSLSVTGSHQVTLLADEFFEEERAKEAHGLILPGGMPGTNNLNKHEGLCRLLQFFHEQKKPICAICAAPLILGELGILQGLYATIYPGMEDRLTGAILSHMPVCVDGHIMTSRGPGTAIPFALALAELFTDTKTAEKLKEDIVYQI